MTEIRNTKRAEVAAQAARDVYDLEQQVLSLQGERDTLTNRVSLVEEANQMLHEELEATKKERDFYKEINTRIKTLLTTSGSLILEAFNAADPPSTKDVYAPSGHAKLAAALADTGEEQGPPLPKFFQQEMGRDR